MQKPHKAGSFYYNYEGFHSVVLMVVADAGYKFLYVDVGTEGGASDEGTWRNCTLRDAGAVEENRVGLIGLEHAGMGGTVVNFHGTH